jgi:hypothetical protein
MTGYDFHPEASLDLLEIWDFIDDDKSRYCRQSDWGYLGQCRSFGAFPESGP